MYILGIDKLLEYLNLEHLHVPIPQGVETLRDTISTREIKQILREAEKQDIQTYVITRFVTDFDCRPHEITKSQWKWIRGNKIFFNDCKTGNNYGFITDELKIHLDKLRKWQRYKSKYIFVNQHGRFRGKKLSDNTWVVRETIKQLSKKVIGRELTPQDLRASVITEEYNHYINPKTIQRKARHRSQKTTLKYNHADDKQLEEYVEQGTIFNINNSFISKPVGIDKRSSIYILPQDHFKSSDEENNSFSFSISFFEKHFFREINRVVVLVISSGLGYIQWTRNAKYGERGGKYTCWGNGGKYVLWTPTATPKYRLFIFSVYRYLSQLCWSRLFRFFSYIFSRYLSKFLCNIFSGCGNK